MTSYGSSSTWGRIGKGTAGCSAFLSDNRWRMMLAATDALRVLRVSFTCGYVAKADKSLWVLALPGIR